MRAPDRADILFDMAVSCAYARQTNRCANQWGSQECSGCMHNIVEFSEASMQDLRLFMIGAERQAHQVKLFTKPGVGNNTVVAFFTSLVKIAAVLVLFIGLPLYGLKQCKADNAHKVREWLAIEELQKSKAAAVTAAVAPKAVSNSYDVDKAVWATLKAVDARFKAHADVNYDGETNCIDAAVLFYELYPVKEDVCIERNSKLLHAFNCVKIDGVWRAVEPQAAVNGWTTTYLMRDIWGKEYDASHNEDAWYKYGRYVK